jgi:hypothetical protein
MPLPPDVNRVAWRIKRVAQANSLVKAFTPGGQEQGFPNIGRQDVVNGLNVRISQPWLQSQGTASLCGPAAFLYCVLFERPELYTQYVIDLYVNGEAWLGQLHVKPSDACRGYKAPPNTIDPVDWIALASLRDSDNSILHYSSAEDATAGITMPHSVEKWFNKLGWSSVRNDTNVLFLKGRDEVDDCIRNFDHFGRVCLFVNMKMFDPAKLTHQSLTPNHWVVLAKPMTVVNDTISFGVYSWGQIFDVPQNGAFPLRSFYRNFYGYVSTTP